ncbi:hypothetical protein M409DRAFT_55580 [Zasmidium cellare ATCC 36951]|uniref:Uncharacterized protein n=1 Tax=Zasmidium cellare ATCC 36951 TaxID=1080233 RepID=A0A6A6CEQ4_ZASCE|nr:uncharacterized protein M409DRAFT_55580 [Zasmidium cellare ATCC 36951]KAF2165694.1 hypothetical protein M409DRAFT_55580 [Zasmidium cellare ATCC 36951]
MVNSRFIGNTDPMKEDTTFKRVGDAAAPNFRPDPAAQPYLDAMAAEQATEKEREKEREDGDRDDEKEALFRVYFDSGLTNEAILSGPLADIDGKALLQLRVTMTSQELLDAIEAKHGAGAIKITTLHRRFGSAFDDAAAEDGVDVATMKDAFNKVSTVSRARKTGWTRPDAKGQRKASASTSKSSASGSKGKKVT